eukprot:GEMP01053218.1.p1 GENE.GEMP01053218.1~~GEMP01053218.1.p1  ORF type:complete len:320 (+),score=69.98 GEMP01053218.1:76-960(+)
MAPVTAAGVLDAPREDLDGLLSDAPIAGDTDREATKEDDKDEEPDIEEYPPMGLRQVLRWCMKGDSAIGRLDALCKFGPLVDGQLRAGFYKCERAMSDAELRQMVWSEHAAHWKALLPARDYLDDVIPLTLGVHKGKSIYLGPDLREILRESIAEQESDEKVDGPIDFKKLQKVVSNHRRRRFRSAHSVVLHGGMLGSTEVSIKKVKEMSRPPKEKEPTITEQIDREVAKHGGQVMMQRKTTRKLKERRQRHAMSNSLASDSVLTTITIARQTDNWWGMQVPRTAVKPNPIDGV